ncbi:MAG TPA: hypothetical protein VFL66_00110 [Gaiellaceae bacterium]|nr:hypothetical protein [Gaiellaceae bacterium]
MKRHAIRGRRALVAAGLTAALAVPVAIFTGMGAAASSTAAQAQYAPSNTGAPTISGTAQEGQKLTATTGTWSSSTDVKYAFQWQRCNSSGAACVDIASANSQSYTVAAADVGNKLRVIVTATNKDGSSRAQSATTAVVTSKTTQGTSTSTTVAVTDVNPPDRLVVDQVKFSPNPVPSRTTITARFHVKDVTAGKNVSGALVYAIGLPYSRVSSAPEVKTGTDGWATMTFQPAKFFPRHGYVTFFVRARKAGDDLLSGISTRRLVQITVNR